MSRITLNGKLYILAVLAPTSKWGRSTTRNGMKAHRAIGKTRSDVLRIESPRKVRTQSGQRYEVEGTERNMLVDYRGQSCEKQTLTSAQQHSPWRRRRRWTGILWPCPPGYYERKNNGKKMRFTLGPFSKSPTKNPGKSARASSECPTSSNASVASLPSLE